MSSLAQVRREIIASLERAGIEKEEAQHEARLIIEAATGFSTAQQELHAQDSLAPDSLARIQAMVKKREERFPLQYLLGRTWFYGLEFKVRPGVLIPRADTELLVAVALRFLQERGPGLFIDLGTGSGAIAVTLLHHLPGAKCIAVDISSTAIAVARENAQLHGVIDRLTLVQAHWEDLAPVQALALVSNPPYVPISTAPELQPEVAVFEPKEAVFGVDADGLGVYRQLGGKACRYLVEDGLLAVEVGKGQAEQVEQILEKCSWRHIDIHQDLNRIPRVVSALRPN